MSWDGDQPLDFAQVLRIQAAQPGVVYLVGAGPGDPGLLTARAVQLLRTADVVLHDQLIPASSLSLVRAGCELIDVGKIGGGRQVEQNTTNDLLVARAGAGLSVVRLKGGDPFVFGRGGEELQVLQQAGLKVEVVSGVSSGTAGPGAVGIPVTHRDHSSAVALVTGHARKDHKPDAGAATLDWTALAAFPGTLVIFMGVRSLQAIVDRLIEGGRDAGESAAIVERATLPGQRVLRGTLETLPSLAAAEGARAPALIVVGSVVDLAEQLDLASLHPLSGRRVVVTRATDQAGGLATQLHALGAEVLELPAIKSEPTGAPLPAAFGSATGSTLLCVTSPGATNALVAALRCAGRDLRALAGMTVAAVGPGTAAALRARGIEPEVVAQRAVSEGLLAELDAHGLVGLTSAVIIQAEDARPVLSDGLAERGLSVEAVALHRTVRVALDDAQRAELQSADAILFASGSAVRSVLESLGGDPAALVGRSVSIGPITTAALREAGVEPAVEADPHTPDGLIAATLEQLAVTV